MEVEKTDTSFTDLFGDEKLRELMGEKFRHISSQLVAVGLKVDLVPLAIVVTIAVVAVAIFLLCKFDIYI